MKHFQLCILTIMLLSLFALAHSLEITSSLDWCGTSPCKLHREGTCRSLLSFLPQSFPLPSFILLSPLSYKYNIDTFCPNTPISLGDHIQLLVSGYDNTTDISTVHATINGHRYDSFFVSLLFNLSFCFALFLLCFVFALFYFVWN